MRKVALCVTLLAAVVWAGPVSWSVTTTGGGGTTPASSVNGVGLSNMTVLRVSVAAVAGTVTGGKVCAFYKPPASTVGAAWRHNGLLDLTLSSNVAPDGGTESSQQLPDLAVVGQYGFAAYVPCGLTGTASDGGVNQYTVTTEAWGPSLR